MIPLVGASSSAQLDESLAAVDLDLTRSGAHGLTRPGDRAGMRAT